jgi:c-di-GMP-binding flagellar brake protein YcgR
VFFKKTTSEDLDNLKTKDQDSLLTSAEEIYGALLKITGKNKRVNIEIDGDKTAYTARIIKSSFKSLCFMFDDLNPSTGHEKILAAQKFVITTDFQGVLIQFTIERDITFHQESRCFIAYFPESLLYKQRRNSFRAMIPKGMRPGITIHLPDKDLTITGTVNDISSSGCRAQIKGDLTRHGLSGVLSENCIIRFLDERLVMSIQIRHSQHNEEQEFTTLGIAFLNIKGMQQRTIDKYVSQLQFEQRRRQTEENELKG